LVEVGDFLKANALFSAFAGTTRAAREPTQLISRSWHLIATPHLVGWVPDRRRLRFFIKASGFATATGDAATYNDSMQVTTEHRDRVIAQLTTDFAADRFDVDELDRRVALAHSAESMGALDALVPDLAPTTTALVPAKQMRVVFGSVERIGPWQVPSQLAARVVCGNLVLDLREAQLPAGGVTIDVNVTMGNLEILVPPGVAIDLDATPVLGNVEDRSETRGATAYLVRVTGRVRLGNVEVSTRLRGETEREARWRHRRDRWARRHARRFWH
jgi:hypothetical protein